MPRGEMKAKNRRVHAEPEGHGFWEVINGMGMPLLYIGALVAGTVGTISMGVISRYWSDLKTPMCFLYSKTASNLIVYHFGTNVATCTWVTYGAVTALVLGFLTAAVYWIKVRGGEEIDTSITLVVVGIVITTLFMLAVSCTMAEGMRLTCAAMDLNSANNKGSDCYEKLDIRAHLSPAVLATWIVSHIRLIQIRIIYPIESVAVAYSDVHDVPPPHTSTTTSRGHEQDSTREHLQIRLSSYHLILKKHMLMKIYRYIRLVLLLLETYPTLVPL